MSHPQRCHLLIGPPDGGKSTLALQLATLLTAPGDPPAVVTSTDRIRRGVTSHRLDHDGGSQQRLLMNGRHLSIRHLLLPDPPSKPRGRQW